MTLVYSPKKSGKSDFFTTMNFNIWLWFFRKVNFQNFQKVTLYGYLSISLFVIFLLSKLILGIIQKCYNLFAPYLNLPAITDVINDIINGIMMKLLPSQMMSLMKSLGGTI